MSDDAPLSIADMRASAAAVEPEEPKAEAAAVAQEEPKAEAAAVAPVKVEPAEQQSAIVLNPKAVAKRFAVAKVFRLHAQVLLTLNDKMISILFHSVPCFQTPRRLCACIRQGFFNKLSTLLVKVDSMTAEIGRLHPQWDWAVSFVKDWENQLKQAGDLVGIDLIYVFMLVKVGTRKLETVLEVSVDQVPSMQGTCVGGQAQGL